MELERVNQGETSKESLGYFAPVMVAPQRPFSVVIVAGLAIVYGGLMLFVVSGPYMWRFAGRWRDFVSYLGLANYASLFLWNYLCMFFCAVVLIVGGVQCLRLRMMGRWLMFFYAFFILLQPVVLTLLYVVYLHLRRRSMGLPEFQYSRITYAGLRLREWPMTIAQSAAIFYVFTRANVRAAFLWRGHCGGAKRVTVI